MNDKIGVGIVTMQPRKTFDKCFDFWHHNVDHIVVVNDGKPFEYNWSNGFRNKYVGKSPDTSLTYCQNDGNLGVGITKNRALQLLLNLKCDHIFLIEDDIYIKDQSVFQAYIDASKRTGIQHFNFSQHGMMNKIFDGKSNPNPRIVMDYGDMKIPLYPHCVGAFSYYSRKCLETVGLMDEDYYNACEHVDHTLGIINAGMHPPFWYFADIEDSWYYLGDEEWSLDQSTISSKDNHGEIVAAADKVFLAKHGCLPSQIPLTIESGVIQSLKDIKNENK